jgi:MoxR-like ATPase
MMTVRAAALLDGRLAPTPDDVIDMARPVLMHRMALSFAAKARGETLGDLIDSVVVQVGKSEAAA